MHRKVAKYQTNRWRQTELPENPNDREHLKTISVTDFKNFEEKNNLRGGMWDQYPLATVETRLRRRQTFSLKPLEPPHQWICQSASQILLAKLLEVASQRLECRDSAN